MSQDIVSVQNIFGTFQQQMNVTDIKNDDIGYLPKINAFIEQHLDQICDQFYEKILTVSQLANIIAEHSMVEKLKRTMRRHLQTMFTDQLNEEYVAERSQIALIHYLVKLEPKWYIAAFQYLNTIISKLLLEKIDDKGEAAFLSIIIAKYISIEMQIVLEAYEMKVLSNIEIDDLIEKLDE